VHDLKGTSHVIGPSPSIASTVGAKVVAEANAVVDARAAWTSAVEVLKPPKLGYSVAGWDPLNEPS
jgi:hypothetical protein